MTDKLKDWDTTAANNNSTPPNGWPENMAPSDVNNSARQGMASVAEWYDDAEWLHYGHTASAYTSTTLTISGDVTAKYVAGRKIRLDQDSSKVAKVESSSYSAPNTTVTVSGYTIAALPSIVELHLVSDEDYLPIIPPEYPTGYLTDCRLSADTDADHDIQVSTGGARDATDAANITLASVITKQIDAAWAEGDNAGGLPSGVTLSGPEWLYFFLIAKTDGTVDAGFDDNASATNLLTDASTYTYYRHIGSVRTDSSNNIEEVMSNIDIGRKQFRQVFTSSGTFYWPPLVQSINAVAVGGGGGGAAGTTGTASTITYNSVVASGGGGGGGGGTSIGGTATGGDLNMRGGDGNPASSTGGAAPGPYGGQSVYAPLHGGSTEPGNSYGGGGAASGSAGGAGGCAIKLYSYVSGQDSAAIVVGSGGGSTSSSSNGAGGVVVVEW